MTDNHLIHHARQLNEQLSIALAEIEALTAQLADHTHRGDDVRPVEVVMRYDHKCNKRPFPKVDAFLSDIKAVCLRHSMTIGHEDGHGSFVIDSCDGEDDLEWLMGADVGYTIKSDPPLD